MLETLYICYIFGVFGLGCEVVFTALGNAILAKNNKYFFGHSSILYFPLYAFFVPVFYILFYESALKDVYVFYRLPIYGIVFQVGEYFGMMSLHKIFGKSPTEDSYRLSGKSINGFTRVDYLPAFCLLGYLYEKLFLLVTN